MADRDAPIYDRLAKVPERQWEKGAGLDALLEGAREPFVLRGFVADWPLVAAGRGGGRAARRYLLDHARERPFKVSIGPPGHDGRLFYDADMEMNFRVGTGRLPDIFGGIDQAGSRDLNLVMGPATKGASVPFRVFLDGEPADGAYGVDVDPDGRGTATDQRTYQLIRQSGPIAARRFEIEFGEAGAEVYCFTFG